MHRFIRRLHHIALGFCAAGAVTLAAAQGAAPATYNVGATATGIPFTFLDVKTNSIQGMMVDTIQAVAKAGGFQVNVQQTVFSALIPSLTSNKIDIVSAAMLKTPTRQQVVDFSDPVYSYGEGLIVKADDLGLMLARTSSSATAGAVLRAVGCALVRGMPYFLKMLGIVGTAAMIWVGGGIILHGLETYGFGWLSHVLHGAGEAVARFLPRVASFASWLVMAAGSGLAGLAIGALAIPAVSLVVSPAWRWLKNRFHRARATQV